jgi:hypothetical protein
MSETNGWQEKSDAILKLLAALLGPRHVLLTAQ